MAEIATTCPYCGCGCGLYLHVSDGQITGVAPSRSHPVAQGRLCLKGWHAHEFTDNPARLTKPLVRHDGELREASWKEAITAVRSGLKKVLSDGGPRAVGLLGSGRCANEDNYVLARFARGTLGTPNLDCSLRTGEPITSGEMADLDGSDLIVLICSDPNEGHPAVAARIYRARQRGATLITISTRHHALTRLAEVHLPVRPDAEGHVLAGLIGLLVASAEGEGEVATIKQGAAAIAPEAIQSVAGVAAEDLRRAADVYLKAKHVSIVYASALTLSSQAVTAVSALANLFVLGRAGLGPQTSLISLLSRSNLQGCLDMGISPDMLPGYASLDDEAAAGALSQVWGGEICGEQGLSAWQMLGEVQALYVMGDDITRSAGDRAAVEKALSELQLLVVQDVFLSPVARLAHVVLPAAAFGEREGTLTSLERRVQRIRRAVAPPGEAREDWRIVAEISAALGKPMPYQGCEEIFSEIASVVPVYQGLSYGLLDRVGGARWPAGAAEQAATPLFRWQGTSQPMTLNGATAEPSEEYPLLLVADVSLKPWDEETTIASTLTVGVEFTVVSRDYPNGMLCLHPEDARRLGLRIGGEALVKSPRGECTMKVLITAEAPPGIALVAGWQAARLGVMETAVYSDTDRPGMRPTPVSITPV